LRHPRRRPHRRRRRGVRNQEIGWQQLRQDKGRFRKEAAFFIAPDLGAYSQQLLTIV
ncbi:MAG: hypothetical protein ACI9NG_001235, partial [Hyphomonas sp.]